MVSTFRRVAKWGGGEAGGQALNQESLNLKIAYWREESLFSERTLLILFFSKLFKPDIAGSPIVSFKCFMKNYKTCFNRALNKYHERQFNPIVNAVNLLHKTSELISLMSVKGSV